MAASKTGQASRAELRAEVRRLLDQGRASGDPHAKQKLAAQALLLAQLAEQLERHHDTDQSTLGDR